MEQHVMVGLDELNSGATKEVVGQISQQPASPDGVDYRDV
jgi:hypothetical protein